MFRKLLLIGVLATGAYLALLNSPEPLFAHRLTNGGVVLHADVPISGAMDKTLAQVSTRLLTSRIYDASTPTHVFLASDPKRFALFARQNYKVGGVADWVVGQHVFLGASDMEHNRMLTSDGEPVEDRPLSYFIAHEAMHIALARYTGRLVYSQLPTWLDEGYADYIARDIDYKDALAKMREGHPDLDPSESGLFTRYHLMVAFLIEYRGRTIESLLENIPDRPSVERELMTVSRWP